VININFVNHFQWKWSVSDDSNLTEQKILSFKNLKPGWRYGEGVEINPYAISTGIALNKEASNLGFMKTSATPIENGGISLIILHDNDELEFVIDSENSIYYYLEQNGEEIVEEPELNKEQTLKKINDYWESKCMQSGCLSWGNISPNNTNLTVQLHSQIREITQVSPSWITTA